MLWTALMHELHIFYNQDSSEKNVFDKKNILYSEHKIIQYLTTIQMIYKLAICVLGC